MTTSDKDKDIFVEAGYRRSSIMKMKDHPSCKRLFIAILAVLFGLVLLNAYNNVDLWHHKLIFNHQKPEVLENNGMPTSNGENNLFQRRFKIKDRSSLKLTHENISQPTFWM
ncbi:uncharacterized protein LOC144346061 [Saccoglossus kowalevskii]